MFLHDVKPYEIAQALDLGLWVCVLVFIDIWPPHWKHCWCLSWASLVSMNAWKSFVTHPTTGNPRTVQPGCLTENMIFYASEGGIVSSFEGYLLVRLLLSCFAFLPGKLWNLWKPKKKSHFVVRVLPGGKRIREGNIIRISLPNGKIFSIAPKGDPSDVSAGRLNSALASMPSRCSPSAFCTRRHSRSLALWHCMQSPLIVRYTSTPQHVYYREQLNMKWCCRDCVYGLLLSINCSHLTLGCTRAQVHAWSQ